MKRTLRSILRQFNIVVENHQHLLSKSSINEPFSSIFIAMWKITILIASHQNIHFYPLSIICHYSPKYSSYSCFSWKFLQQSIYPHYIPLLMVTYPSFPIVQALNEELSSSAAPPRASINAKYRRAAEGRFNCASCARSRRKAPQIRGALID